jgi:GntR family transcriptional regulator
MREDDDYTGSLYELLEKKYRIVIVGGEEKITATIADSHRAKLLEIPKGSPLISIQRTTFSNHQVPIEIIEGYYRADRFYFTIQLHRDLEKSIPRLVHSNRGFRSTSL